MELDRPIRTVLFDAGGVLLDLDYSYLRRLVQAKRIDVDIERLAEEEARARTEIHRRVQGGERGSAVWRDYFHFILGNVGVREDEQAALIDTLWEAHQRFGLWTAPIDGSIETVKQLKSRGFAVGVVSNAEGRVEQDLDRAGYAGLFRSVVDSHVVGVEKPDKQIFEIALDRVGGDADTTLFIGDVPSIDVAGARNAGLFPVLLDRHGIYPDEPVLKMTRTSELLDLLPEPAATPTPR